MNSEDIYHRNISVSQSLLHYASLLISRKFIILIHFTVGTFYLRFIEFRKGQSQFLILLQTLFLTLFFLSCKLVDFCFKFPWIKIRKVSLKTTIAVPNLSCFFFRELANFCKTVNTATKMKIKIATMITAKTPDCRAENKDEAMDEFIYWWVLTAVIQFRNCCLKATRLKYASLCFCISAHNVFPFRQVW